MMRRAIFWLVVLGPVWATAALGADTSPPVKFTGGGEADLQALLDKAPEGAVVVCRQALEDVKAVGCRHVIRTANSPRKHANLTLRDFTATNCEAPVQISNTTHVRVENLSIIDEPAAGKPRITLRNCDDVVLRNVTVKGLKEGVEAVQTKASTAVKIEGLKRDAKERTSP